MGSNTTRLNVFWKMFIVFNLFMGKCRNLSKCAKYTEPTRFGMPNLVVSVCYTESTRFGMPNLVVSVCYTESVRFGG